MMQEILGALIRKCTCKMFDLGLSVGSHLFILVEINQNTLTCFRWWNNILKKHFFHVEFMTSRIVLIILKVWCGCSWRCSIQGKQLYRSRYILLVVFVSYWLVEFFTVWNPYLLKKMKGTENPIIHICNFFAWFACNCLGKLFLSSCCYGFLRSIHICLF